MTLLYYLYFTWADRKRGWGSSKVINGGAATGEIDSDVETPSVDLNSDEAGPKVSLKTTFAMS